MESADIGDHRGLRRDVQALAGLFAIGVVSIFLARVGPLILGLFVLGMGMEVVYMSIAAWLIGGNIDTVIALPSAAPSSCMWTSQWSRARSSAAAGRG